MKLVTELTIETKNKIIKQEANSLLKNFFGILTAQMKQNYIPYGARDVNGNWKNVNQNAGNFKVLGIRIGSGTTAVDICNDYNLEAELSDISYSNLDINLYCNENETGITIYQEATNNATSAQNVNETGILVEFWSGAGKYNGYIDRTVLVETVTLESEQTMKITYKIKYVA